MIDIIQNSFRNYLIWSAIYMKLNIAICDDEEMFIEIVETRIKEYMRNQGMEYAIDKYSSGEELLEQNSESFPYQLIFLDIKMGDINGLQVAEKLNQRLEQATIVFITSYIDFALAGYKVGAVRYILKNDINFKLEFEECMNSVMQKYKLENRVELFSFNDGEKYVRINQIMYIESALHRVVFHIKEKQGIVTHYMYTKLDDVEKQLVGADFFRVHKSFLVNFQFVEQITRYAVTFYNHQTVGISKKRYEDIKREFLLYKGKK